MSLSPLLKYIYNHGTEEMIRRGKRIYSTGGASLLDNDPFIGQARFRVRNDQYQNFYTVVVQRYDTPADMQVRCQCPYNMSEVCRHKVAALFQLHDLAQSGILKGDEVRYDQNHTLLRLRTVSEPMLRLFSRTELVDAAKEAARARMATLHNTAGDTLEADVPDPDSGKTFFVRLKQNEERYFDTSCGCTEDRVPLCYHKAVVFLQVFYERGADYFHGMRNWDEQKARLLALYGYKLTDDLSGKFAFTYDVHGKPSLRVLDTTIKRIATAPQASSMQRPAAPLLPAPALPEAPGKLRLLPALETGVSSYPYVTWQLLKAKEEDDTVSAPYDTVTPDATLSAVDYPEADRELLPLFRKAQVSETLRYLKKVIPFGELFLQPSDDLGQKLTPDYRLAFWEYLLPKYHRILSLLPAEKHGYLFRTGTHVRTLTMGQEVSFSNTPFRIQVFFTLQPDGSIRQRMRWLLNDYVLPEKEVQVLNMAMICYQHTLYVLDTPAEVLVHEALLEQPSEKDIPAAAWPGWLEQEVLKWPPGIEVQFAPELVLQKPSYTPVLRLHLEERENTLVLRPVADYGGTEIIGGRDSHLRQAQNGRVILQERDLAAEAGLLQQVQALHSDMIRSADQPVFFLPAQAVLSENWFFRFLDTMRDAGVEVTGLEQLRSLRLNTHKPETSLRIASGIDWFDADLTLRYGDQEARIPDLRKALAARQNYVRLPDGTLGLLPEEWLEKYSLLLKMGDTRSGRIRLRSTHYGVIEQLLAEVDEEELLRDLQARKEKLVAIANEDYSRLDAPVQLKAALRPYQLTGFQWLVFLHEAGWGGILADDMGLGKTVQAIAFYLYLKEKNEEAKLLVVCPTTLIYNWEAEIQKFAPQLQVYIHHGPRRRAAIANLSGYHIVITTYGTLRSDIKVFREIPYDCVVLDESQAIKNPQSQVAKAALLLQAKHRLALSGTPLQNNTFDLYSQMNFLNPGMLGSREFFMNEFATPIDKFGEASVKRQLRQLTYPFVLRRTKEQVAKDLPEKTETILYCEMGPVQRRLYNSWRVIFKDQILGMIDRQGMEKSHLHILQGLTRLRQICDATSLAGGEEHSDGETHSVKLEELMRELEENTGNHKVLVFSQFIGMLALIRSRLEAAGISHAYFDGSTPAAERRREVNRFQEEEDCRVFVISLKAGGVGLNLTAAEYVYLVDPWWNPAVEQQAIDRTHRIGQTKPVFAYRMICRDSIEEKMLILQERKRVLAEELVADDGAILKRLTRDDIQFLLS